MNENFSPIQKPKKGGVIRYCLKINSWHARAGLGEIANKVYRPVVTRPTNQSDRLCYSVARTRDKTQKADSHCTGV
jgi:hypothetical protein